MRRNLLLVTLVLLLLAPSVSALAVQRPGYDVGDEWRYSILVTDSGSVVERGDRHIVVLSRGPVAFHGSTREAVFVGAWENRTLDGETIPSRSETAYDAGSGAFLLTRSGGSETSAESPCLEIEYPVEMGDRWTAQCRIGDVDVETFYSVAGGERLVVPAGPYDTLAVDKVGDLVGRVWLARETCGRPVAELYQVNERATYVNLTSASCRMTSEEGSTETTPTGATPTEASPTPGTHADPTPSSPPPQSISMALPNLTSGDLWEYETEGSHAGHAWRMTSQVKAGREAPQSDAADVYHTAQSLTQFVQLYPPGAPADAIPSAVYSWVRYERVTDGATVSERQFATANQLDDDPQTNITRRYDPPCAFVQWPLVAGKEWTIDCKGDFWKHGMEDETPSMTTGTGRVAAPRTAQVPAGSFQVFPVVLTYTVDGVERTETRLYAPETCGPIELPMGDLDARGELTKFECRALTGAPEPVAPTPAPGALGLLAAAGVALLVARRKLR